MSHITYQMTRSLSDKHADPTDDGILDPDASNHPDLQLENTFVDSVGVEPTTTDRPDDVFIVVPEFEVTCPACVGQHRAHDHSVGCRLGPMPRIPLTAPWGPFTDAPDRDASDGGGEGASGP